MKSLWFITLISGICLEGLGRKYLPGIPAPVFYFFKDIVLLIGYLQFRPPLAVTKTVKYLYRGFEVFFIGSFIWTAIEIFNPEQQSFVLGLIGMRAYWVWWAAPPIIASALQNKTQKDKAIYALSVMGIGIAMLAAAQFASPADSAINLYSVQDGEAVYAADVATVASTGRARVSGTFTFLSGFVAFTVTAPTLLLSLGLDSQSRKTRTLALLGTFATAATIPMSGSRGALVLGLAIIGTTMWSSGLFFTRIGRRVLIGAITAGILSVVVFPDALFGVESRFGDAEETLGRFEEVASIVVPPLALATFKYPVLGIGTGMQQNSKSSFHVYSEWDAENEIAKYLVELGPVGFLLFWCAKLGLMVALYRAYQILKRAGRRGSSGAALSYSALSLISNLTFDHNWQALYFMGCGFVLSEVVEVMKQRKPIPALDADSAPAQAIERPSPAWASQYSGRSP